MSGLVHLARRFLGSLSPTPLAPEDGVWIEAQLNPGERALWARMAKADQKHAAGVAREVARDLGPAATRPVLAAAALHDVGKVESQFSTVSRALVTVLAGIWGRDRLIAAGAGRTGWRRRVAAYLDHDRIGAELLVAAGSDGLTSTWAAQHHRPRAKWTLPAEIGAALAAADDD